MKRKQNLPPSVLSKRSKSKPAKNTEKICIPGQTSKIEQKTKILPTRKPLGNVSINQKPILNNKNQNQKVIGIQKQQQIKEKVINIKAVEGQIERLQKVILQKQQQLNTIDQEIFSLDGQLALKFQETNEYQIKLENSVKQHQVEMSNLSEKLEHELKIREKEKERESMCLEDRQEIVSKCNNLRDQIINTEKKVNDNNEKIINLRKSILEISELKKAKSEHISALKCEFEGLNSELNEHLDRENKQFNEDIQLEFMIHRMKGKLYTFLIYENLSVGTEDKLNSYKIKCDGIEMKIPEKENSWSQYKFDGVISEKLSLKENFTYSNYLYSFTELMLKDIIINPFQIYTEIPKQEKIDEILFWVLSNKAKYKQIKSYLEYILKNCDKIFDNKSAIKNTNISITLYGTVPKIIAENSGVFGNETTLIKNTFKIIKDILKTDQNAFIKIIIRHNENQELKLVFAFSNIIKPENIDDLKKYVKEANLHKTGKKSLIKDSENFQQILNNVKLGYLLVLSNNLSDDLKFYELIETAHFIEENIPCIRTEINMPINNSLINTQKLF